MERLNEKCRQESCKITGGIYKTVQSNSKNFTDNNQPVLLQQQQIDELLYHLPKNANQAKRFTVHVGSNPDSPTAKCNVAAAAVNLSDIAIKYNPYLRKAGYELRCRLPERLILNRFKEPTMQHCWSLYSVGVER